MRCPPEQRTAGLRQLQFYASLNLELAWVRPEPDGSAKRTRPLEVLLGNRREAVAQEPDWSNYDRRGQQPPFGAALALTGFPEAVIGRCPTRNIVRCG